MSHVGSETARQQSGGTITVRTPESGWRTTSIEDAQQQGIYKRQVANEQAQGQIKRTVRGELQSTGSDLVTAGLSGKYDKGGLLDLAKGLGNTVARDIGNELVRQIASGDINDTFQKLSDVLGKNIQGLGISAQNLGLAAYGLSGLINGMGGKGGKGKPDLLDGVIAIGSLFPATAPFAGGLKLARNILGFADGGRLPLNHMAVVAAPSGTSTATFTRSPTPNTSCGRLAGGAVESGVPNEADEKRARLRFARG